MQSQPHAESVRIVDMSASNSWAEFAGLYRATRSAFLDHERVRAQGLDVKETSRHWVMPSDRVGVGQF
jgi:hypothetical protein